MRSLKFTTFAILATCVGMTSVVSLAHAQTPTSGTASNIVPADTRSDVAPALPVPPVGDNAAPRTYLKAAHDALVAGRTGEAQQSLEMAETRELSRAVDPGAAAMPDANPSVTRIRDALQMLGEGNRQRALEIIDAMAE